MAISKGVLKGRVLRLLMKTSAKPGFYTDDLFTDSLQEAIDFVASEMMLANEGWQTKITFLDTVAGQLTVNVPPNVCMIQELRYKFGTVYIPLVYDDGSKEMQYTEDSGVRQWAYCYRIVDNAFYFNPPFAEGGTGYLMLESMNYPKIVRDDADFLENHFDNGMQHYLKYRTATIMAQSAEKMVIPWASSESLWYGRIRDMIIKRNLQSVAIREFEG